MSSPKASISNPDGSNEAKRKLCYKMHYMYEYILPAKVLAALQWLKLNNPLYIDIEMSNDWFSDAVDDGSSDLKYIIIIRCSFHSCM